MTRHLMLSWARWDLASLRVCLSLVVAGVVVASVMFTASWNAWETFSRDIDNQRTLLESAASAYAAGLADPLKEGDRGEALELLRGIRDIPSVVQADVRQADGSVFVQLGTGAILVGRDGYSSKMTPWQVWSADRMKIAVPIIDSAEEVGQLNFLADITGVRTKVISSLQVTALLALFSAGLGIAFAQWLIDRITGPLRQLTTRMNAFAADPTASHAPLAASDAETRILVETFTDMVGSIRERDRRIAHHMETLEATVDERTRDLRQARDDAEAANAAKSDFLATMSHEIRTPMNGMLVMAEMLSSANLSAKHRRYAEIISRSGQGLLTIIDDILDLSKIEAGRLELESAAFSPEDIVLDIAALFWERAREKTLTLGVHVSPRVPVLVTGDPTRLSQIITNLVNNALKFTTEGGVSIMVSAADEDPSRLVFAVRDTGIGIPLEKQASIFDAFTQADQSTTRQFGGTGLGLAVCRRLADAMGGTITLTSDPGQGSTFTLSVDLPVVTPAAPQADAGPAVRVAIDDPILRPLLENALADHGAELTTDPMVATLIAPSSIEAGAPALPGPVIGLSDVGDTASDSLLRSGRLADLLPLPYRRSDIQALLERARTGVFRGVAALTQSDEHRTHKTFPDLRVLAVDDSAINREVLREALHLLGVTATFAENGRDALDLVEQAPFDLIFMDGAMPVMDGVAATRGIRELETRLGRTRSAIHALTAGVSDRDAQGWRDAGADGYIAKPFTIERISGVLEAVGGDAGAMASVPDTTLSMSEPAPSTSVPTPDPLFDEETLDRLDRIGSRSGRDVRARLWTLFADKAPMAADDIRAARDHGDPRKLAASAHALKSMALSAGASRLAAHCQHLETLAQSPSTEAKLSSALNDVLGSVDDTLEAMQQHTSAPVAQPRAS